METVYECEKCGSTFKTSHGGECPECGGKTGAVPAKDGTSDKSPN